MMNDTTKNYNIIEQAIEENDISAVEVLDAFVNWHGMQLLDDEFVEFLSEEGIVTE